MSKNKAYSKNKKESFIISWWKNLNKKILPILILVFFVPLYCHLYVGQNVYTKYEWYTGQETYTDIYLHSKAVFFSIVGCVMAVLNVFYVIDMKKDERIALLKRFWPVGVYFLCIVFSAIFSLDHTASFKGAFDQQEPFFVLFGYSMIALYVFLSVKNRDDIKTILFFALAGSAVVAFLGIIQMLGYNLFAKEWFSSLIMSSEQKRAYNIVVNSDGVSSTLYNSNYVGPYVAMILSIAALAFWIVTKTRTKILLALLLVSLLTFLVASGSKTGILIVAGVIVVLLIFLSKTIMRVWFLVIPGLLALVFSIDLYDRYVDREYSTRIVNGLSVKRAEYDLKGIDTSNRWVEVYYKDSTLKFFFENDGTTQKVTAFEDDEEITVKRDNSVSGLGYNAVLSDGEKIPVTIVKIYDSEYAFFIKLENTDYMFCNDHDEDHDMKLMTYSGKYDECIYSNRLLQGLERMFSGRGEIWGETIPLLKKYIFFGAGPDCFPIAVGKDGTDYVAKNHANSIYTLYTRPHNLYLQMAVNTGVLSVIAFLTFAVWYVVDCFRLYFFKKSDGDLYRLGVGCFGAVIGFLGTGITNDSLIVVTPLYWCFLGLGMAINRLKMQEKTNG